MNPTQEVLELIPQKPPFLFVDKIIDKTENSLRAQYHVSGDEYFFAGHFPGNPVLPAVVMQEALFQSAALLLSYVPGGGLGVVTRVSDGKFKKMIKPGETLELNVEIEENIGESFYMKGKISVDTKTAVVLKFAVTRISEQ